MRLAAIQHDIIWEDPEANLAKLGDVVDKAAADGAEFIVLSEMFSTGFSMAPERVAETPDGASAQFLAARAQASGAWLAASIPMNLPEAELAQNVLVLAGPSGESHRYAKIHPFSYAGEDEHYQPGDRFLTVEILGVRCTFFICYDLRFADEFWATATDTDCYIVPANWPAARRDHWTTLLRARAIENQAYVVGVNRVGEGDGLVYSGDSLVIDPLGEILADGGDVPRVLIADIRAEHVTEVRKKLPFLPDRRPHLTS